jgi:hypothetical protein
MPHELAGVNPAQVIASHKPGIDAIGIRGIIVHAITEQARSFYLALGFDPSPEDPMTLMVSLADIRSLL